MTTFQAICPICGDRFMRTCEDDLVTEWEAQANLDCFGPCPACATQDPKAIAIDFQGAARVAPDHGTIVRIRKDGQEAWYWSPNESPIEILEAADRSTEITAIIGVDDARQWAAKGIVI